MLLADERWTWERCRGQILSLKSRLGYDERLWILGFELLDDGRLVDRFHEVEVFDPAHDVSAAAVPGQFGAVPQMYWILSTYAAAEDIPLAEELQSLAAFYPFRPTVLSAHNCASLLSYSGQDLRALQAAVQVPFFGEILEQDECAFEVRPLPRVPVTIWLCRGDEDGSAGGTLFFDATAKAYLPNLLGELAWLTVWRLKSLLDPHVMWGHHQMASGSWSGNLPV
jgi:Domain of unknown function (DUF3786)